MQVKAAVFYEPNVPFKIETLELEPPRSGEVLVKVAAAGVCHSDWHLMTGATRHAPPVVPGHDGAGIVEMVGEGVEQVKPGDRVARWCWLASPQWGAAPTCPAPLSPAKKKR